jgi:hypothetical protein
MSAGVTATGFYRNWKARRRIRALQSATPDLMKTYGINPGDIQWILQLPLRYDPLLALEELSKGQFMR